MTAEARPVSAGKAFLDLLIGAVLVAAVIVFLARTDYFIDRFGLHVGDWWIWLVLVAAAFIGAVFWVQGHRVYAMSKRQSAVIGLALAFLPLVGLLVLLLVPPRKRAPVAAEVETTPPAQEKQA